MDDTHPTPELQALVAGLREELQALSRRVQDLEQALTGRAGLAEGAALAAQGTGSASGTPGTAAGLASAGGTPLSSAPVTAPAQPPITEEDLLAIAAAVAAYLGVRAQIRQVRLVQSTAWAQVGRATIHASHRVH